MHFNPDIMWSFRTARFRVDLAIEIDASYEYDGDDENGETQAKIDNGEYVAFDSTVMVFLDDRLLAADSLGGSVYAADEIEQFWTAHRDPNPTNRNSSVMRANHPAGPNVAICHYFPDMVRQAVTEARKALANVPRLRAA